MTVPSVPVTEPTKAVVAAVGGTLTALMSALAAVQVATADGALDLTEWGSLVVAAGTLVTTVYGVWKVTNKPKAAPSAYNVR